MAALTDLPVTSVHIYQLGGPSIWFLYTYLLRSRNSQWRHMWQVCTSVYKCVQCVQECTRVYKCVQVCTIVYKCVQMCKCVQVFTILYNSIQECTRVCKSVYKSAQVWTSVYKFVRNSIKEPCPPSLGWILNHLAPCILENTLGRYLSLNSESFL